MKIENTISTNTVENLTGRDIMHYLFLWSYNWTQEDFKIAFKNSSLGWNYFWDKLQAKCNSKLDNPDNPTNAIVGIILNMDNEHQNMLFDFIFDSKYAEQINTQRETNAWMEEQINKAGQEEEL